MNSVLSFIIVLGLNIFVHEFGHFICAKFFRVKVLKFSLGFGPKIAGYLAGETEYVLSAFPLGGYVKMLGEQPGEKVSAEESSRAFSAKPVWQRFIIVFGGPFSNLLFAVFLFFMIFAISGLPTPVDNAVIGGITAESPAARAGISPGDVILSINDRKTVSWSDVSEIISSSNGAPVTLVIERQGERITITATPEMLPSRNLFGEKVEERFMLGIVRSDAVTYEKISLWQALVAGFNQTWGFIYLTIIGIVKMVQAIIPASELGGPILIAQLAGKQMAAGWVNLIYFMGLISVNLGILNLFPIPILDGGHLMFFSFEALRRKPLSQRTQEIAQQFGLVVLVSLMVFVFYNDLARIFTGG